MKMELLKEMLEHRCNLLLQKSAQVLASKMSPEDGKKVDTVEEWNNSQVFFVHNLAKAYSVLLKADCYLNRFKEIKQSVQFDNKAALECCFRIMCYSYILEDQGTFLMHGYCSTEQIEMI